MKKITNHLESLVLAYRSIIRKEERWITHYRPYSRWVLLIRRLFRVAVYTLITMFVIYVSVKLSWVVIVIPVG